MAKGNRGGQRASGSYSNAPITDGQARIAFNSSKNFVRNTPYKKNTSIEKELKAISKGKTTSDSFASKFTTKNDIDNTKMYLMDKQGFLNGKIQALGSKDELKKNPSLYHERKAVVMAINSLNDQRNKLGFDKLLPQDDITITPTTTYNRWKTRHDANFLAWFGKDRLKGL